MGPLVKNKGKAKAPAFYASSPTPASSKPSNVPYIYAGLVVLGVGYVLIKRSKTISGPPLTVIPSTAADESLITNATNSALAIASLRSHPATSEV